MAEGDCSSLLSAEVLCVLWERKKNTFAEKKKHAWLLIFSLLSE